MKKIVIAPRRTFNELYEIYRKDDPFTDIKFMDKEEVISSLLYNYGSDSLLFIVEKYNKDIALAKKMMSDLIYPIKDVSMRSKELLEIKEDLLDHDLLKKNIYFEYELSNASIDIHFYSKKDQVLNYFLEKYNPTYFEYTPRTDLEVHKFKEKEDELIFAFNEIASLIKKGVNPNDIFIYGLKKEDDLTLKRITSNFGININNFNYELLITDRDVYKEFIKFNSDSDFDKLIEELEPKVDNLLKLKNILETYRIKSLKNEEQLRIYIDILNKTYVTPIFYKEAITLIDTPYVKEDKYLFILGFNVTRFPKVISDDGYLTNDEFKKMNLFTLKEKNLSESELYLSYLSSKGKIYISYSLRDKTEKLLPSPFISRLNLKEIDDNYISSYFSMEEARLKLGKEHDIKKNYKLKTEEYIALNDKIKVLYQTYDNSFKGVKHFLPESLLKISYTSISTYSKCAYMYYLERVLKIDEFKDTFITERGNIAHKVLERIDFDTTIDDYEAIFDKVLDESEFEFTAREFYFIHLFKRYFKVSFEYVLRMERNIVDPIILREKPIADVKLSDHILLNGKIDKIILSGPHHEYISVIDYKTGKESFKEKDIPYGFSLQLPTYSLLIENDHRFKDNIILGLFISPLINPDANNISLEDKDRYLKGLMLRGVFLDDIVALESLDPNLKLGSRFIASSSLKKDNLSFKEKQRNRSPEWFVEKRDIARDILLESANKIINNEFPINPKIMGNENKSCTYCPYRDICFKRPKDEVILSTKEEEEND